MLLSKLIYIIFLKSFISELFNSLKFYSLSLFFKLKALISFIISKLILLLIELLFRIKTLSYHKLNYYYYWELFC